MLSKVLCFFLFLAFAVANPPTVNIGQGEVIGQIETLASGLQIETFRGIRYGAPPVGAQRWQPSQLAGPFPGGVLHASADGAWCYQIDQEFGTPTQSEDCLFLNIYRRHRHSGDDDSQGDEDNAHNLPVFFWIHGAGIVDGSGVAYGPIQNLLNHADIIIVGINYRLNAFGFLALNELSHNDARGVSGNYGITDQQTALTWTQRNIRKFGGDPRRVTVLGQSSGATSLYALLSSPASNGLFFAAIALSGSPNMSLPLSDAEFQHRAAFVSSTRCANLPAGSQTLTCLYSLTPQEIVAALPASWNGAPLFPSDPAGNFQPGLVILDGVTVTHSFSGALRAGLIDVPLIIQDVRDEYDLLPSQWDYDDNPQDFIAFMQSNFLPWSNTEGDQILALYPQPDSNRRWFNDIASDIAFNQGNVFLAQQAALGFDSPVYLGFFAQDPSTPIPNPFSGFMTEAGHLFDWMLAAEVYSIPFQPPSQLGPPYQWTPQASDLAAGNIVRSEWFELAEFGRLRVSRGWRTVDDIDGFPANYNVGVLANQTRTTHANYKKNQYQGLYHLGIDIRFWIVN